MQFSYFHVVNTVISISGTYMKMLISNPGFAYKWFFPAKFVFTFLYILYKLQSKKYSPPKIVKHTLSAKSCKFIHTKTYVGVLASRIISCSFFP